LAADFVYILVKKCVIIDIIGNYCNVDVKLSLFDTQTTERKIKKVIPSVPAFCEVNLDVKVINLLEEMARKMQPRKEKSFHDYMFLKRAFRKKTVLSGITFTKIIRFTSL
jgi:hypothetical protein